MGTISVLLLSALLAVAFAVSGCTHWEKPGATEADYKLQDYECSRDTGMLLNPSLAGGYAWAECMSAHGWTQVKD